MLSFSSPRRGQLLKNIRLSSSSWFKDYKTEMTRNITRIRELLDVVSYSRAQIAQFVVQKAEISATTIKDQSQAQFVALSSSSLVVLNALDMRSQAYDEIPNMLPISTAFIRKYFASELFTRTPNSSLGVEGNLPGMLDDIGVLQRQVGPQLWADLAKWDHF